MKIRIAILSFFLLNACQSSNSSAASQGLQENRSLKQLVEELPTLDIPTALDKTLLSDYPGQQIDLDLVPKLSSPMEAKAVRALAQVQGFGQEMTLLYYAYPTDSEVDDYDQMALIAIDDLGKISAHLPLDIGGTGFAATQNWIKEDGEILTAVIAEMEAVEVEVKTYRFKDGRFTEAREFSKVFQDGSYQRFLEEL